MLRAYSHNIYTVKSESLFFSFHPFYMYSNPVGVVVEFQDRKNPELVRFCSTQADLKIKVHKLV